MRAGIHTFSSSREKVISVPAVVEVCQYWHWHGLAGIVSLGGVGERGEELELGNWIQG